MLVAMREYHGGRLMRAALGIALLLAALGVGAQEADPLTTREEVRTLIDAVMEQIVDEEYAPAFATLTTHSHPRLAASMPSLEQQTRDGIREVRPAYGAPVRSEFVREENASESLMRLTYLELFESFAVRWEFLFLKPQDRWLLVNVLWNDSIEELF